MTTEIRRARVVEAELCRCIRNQAILAQCQVCYPLIQEHPFYVAENSQGQLPATGYLDGERHRVEAMFTLPEAMRQGYAARIITRIKQEVLAQGLNTITLSSTPNAQGFYIKQGFQRVRDDTHFSPAAHYAFDCVEMVCPLG